MATLKTSLWSHSCLALLPVLQIVFLFIKMEATAEDMLVVCWESLLSMWASWTPKLKGKTEVTFLNLIFWYFCTSLIWIPVCTYIICQIISSTLFLIAILRSYFIVFHIRNFICFEHTVFDASGTCHSYINAVKWSWQKNYARVCCLFALIACSCLVSEFGLSVGCLVPFSSILAFELSWRKNLSAYTPSQWHIICSGTPNTRGPCPLRFLLPCSSTLKRCIWSVQQLVCILVHIWLHLQTSAQTVSTSHYLKPQAEHIFMFKYSLELYFLR